MDRCRRSDCRARRVSAPALVVVLQGFNLILYDFPCKKVEKVQKCNDFCYVNFALSRKTNLKYFPAHFLRMVGKGLDPFRNKTEWCIPYPVPTKQGIAGTGDHYLRMTLLFETLLYLGC